MEWSFSVKPRALSIVTWASVPSHGSGRTIGFFGGGVLGGGLSIRREWRGSKKLRLKSQSHYSKFLFKASLESQGLLEVASAAAVSAVTVMYFNYSRKQFDIKEISGRVTRALYEHIRSMMSWILTDLNHLDLSKKESIGESKDYIPEIRENNPTEKVRGSRINFKETIMMIEGSAVDEAFHRHLSSSGSIVHNDWTSQISESSEMLSAISVLSDQEIQLFPKEAHEELQEHQNMHADPNSVAPEFSYQVIQGVSEATISPSLLQDEADKPLEDGGANDFNFVSIAFAHKELHTISDAYLEKLDNLEPVSLCATLQKHGSSLALAERPSLSTILPLENFKDENRLGVNGQGFFCQNKKTRKKKDLRKKDKNISETDRAIDRLPSSDPKENNSNSEKPINRLASSGPEEKDHSDKPNPSWQLRVYNQLLREGRLNHCIELLEDLEGKGSLDMDKVYHVRFFEVCRRQKAVKEAFRFTRLIPKPTLSTFNMLMHVCTSSQDSEGAFQVLRNVEEAGLRADCKLYTTLISTCGKSGKVDTMFKVFHEMVNAGVEPNLHTYGALIDGCAKAGQVAKAFGAYGILRSKNVKPDRVVFNALISACGQSGAVDRAFDVLAEMKAEAQPVEPDHVTIGALMKACASADQIDRAREVYNMIHKHDIRGTAELYTIAVNSCSHHGDWEFACRVYDDMMRKGVGPDEMFISALIDVAGHAGKVDAAFEILQEAMAKGMHVGTISYGSLMGACSNAGDWQKAVELYEDVKGLNMKPTVPMMNALITALCNADQLKEAMQILSEMKEIGLCPNTITYSILLVASEKKDELDAGLMLISEAKKDGVAPNLIMCRCLISMCLRRFEAACKIGDSVLSVVPEIVQLNSRWTSLALMVYRETLKAGVAPTVEELSQVLGCLQLPLDASVRSRLVENLGVNMNTSKGTNPFSLIDGFGEYDPRAFSLVEEASSLGVIPLVSFKENPIIVDARNLQVHTAQVYLLTVLKGLKHRLAAGAKLPNVSVMLPTEKAQIQTSAGVKTINIASRVSQAVAALLRRLGISYIGNGSYGRIRINGVTIRKWFQPNLDSPFSKISPDLSSSFRHLGSGISRQRRKIRTGHLSLD